jgi:hypothetical protein
MTVEQKIDLTVTVNQPASPVISKVDLTGVSSDFNSGWRLEVKGGNFFDVVLAAA